MKAFVLDASLAMEWFVASASPHVLEKRTLLDERVAVVPALWRFEVMNVVATWRKRGDVTGAQGAWILNSVLQLPLAVIDEGNSEAIVDLASSHQLSAYDATYLRAAILSGEPLATLDKDLIKAARREGIECL